MMDEVKGGGGRLTMHWDEEKKKVGEICERSVEGHMKVPRVCASVPSEGVVPEVGEGSEGRSSIRGGLARCGLALQVGRGSSLIALIIPCWSLQLVALDILTYETADIQFSSAFESTTGPMLTGNYSKI